ncbi:hypothetical protein OH77DRAFT_1105494 [Trametes cingulata]|nr:hypothetical protein OH77DRAFT_1105494 [Trametes cingulata]
MPPPSGDYEKPRRLARPRELSSAKSDLRGVLPRVRPTRLAGKERRDGGREEEEDVELIWSSGRGAPRNEADRRPPALPAASPQLATIIILCQPSDLPQLTP